MDQTATLFDLGAAVAAGERGIERAGMNREQLRDYIRGLAVRIGRRKRFVTADDVQLALHAQGITDAGNVMGSVFKGDMWRFHDYVKCTRVNSHGRMIREWEWIGK